MIFLTSLPGIGERSVPRMKGEFGLTFGAFVEREIFIFCIVSPTDICKMLEAAGVDWADDNSL